MAQHAPWPFRRAPVNAVVTRLKRRRQPAASYFEVCLVELLRLLALVAFLILVLTVAAIVMPERLPQ